MKEIKKAEVENAIKESLVHWEQQPDCDNKLAQVKYLHESVDSIKEAMDELQAQRSDAQGAEIGAEAAGPKHLQQRRVARFGVVPR